MFATLKLFGIAAVVLMGVSSALAQAPGATANTEKGPVLVDGKGMTLYTYDRDASGKSNCSGQCLVQWPAFLAPADAKPQGAWTLVTRREGKQWAYKGKPLYLWQDDKKPGDATGDGVNNVWRLARP